MAAPQKDPLRSLSQTERNELTIISRSQTLPAVQVIRAKVLLAVAAGASFAQAARSAGRKSGTAVTHLVTRFNQEGLAVLKPRHAGGRPPRYQLADYQKIMQELKRTPQRKTDGTAHWSLALLKRTLRKTVPGLEQISTFTLWKILHRAGYSWQKSRSWCKTGQVLRKRKSGVVEVSDLDALAKQTLIERAYRLGEQTGLAVWNEDEAGPFQTVPYGGQSWHLLGQPARQPHEYIREGTAKLLTLFHPASGQVRVKGVTSSTNLVLHGWLKEALSEIVAKLPPVVQKLSAEENRTHWESWREGLTLKATLPAELPPLRMLLIWDNLAGHFTPPFWLWLVSQGILTLYTPLGGSWLNMAESIQRILKERALSGEHPRQVSQIIEWLEEVAEAWNQHPTPFEWGGKRAERRVRARERRHAVGGSGAYIEGGFPAIDEPALANVA